MNRIIIYIFVVPFLYLIANYVLLHRYYIKIGESKKIKIKGDIFTAKINDVEFTIRNIDGEWHLSDYQNNDKIVNIGEIFYVTSDVMVQIIDNSKFIKKGKWLGSIVVSVAILAPFIFGLNIKFVGEYFHDKEDIDSNNIHLEEQTNEFEENGDDIISIIGTSSYTISEISNISFIRVASNTVFTDSYYVNHDAEDLVDKTVCISYSGELGEECIFVGQYNEKYHWDGECKICAYRDGKLLYLTYDLYEDGELLEYKRISIKSDKTKWIYTDKKILKGNTSGDTWSYAYKDIVGKDYDVDLPREEDLYTLTEIIDMLSGREINHYNGGYDEKQNWSDSTGQAYAIKYDQGKIVSVYKGSFYNNHYLKGWLLSKNEEGEFIITKGEFRDKEGNILSKGVKTSTENYGEVMNLISGEVFKDEIFEWVNNER